MAVKSMVGYFWITLGLFCLIFFGGKLFLQLLGVMVGLSLIFKGLRMLAVDRAMYNYSKNYFEDQFEK